MPLPTLILAALAGATPTLPVDQEAFDCSSCAEWNEAVAPYPLSPHSWFVGTRGLASVLIVDGEDAVLIDGGLPQSAERILASIRATGNDPMKIRWIVNSHAHFDHAGGIAALARITGAQVAAGSGGIVALTRAAYHPDDPQAGFGERAAFPHVAAARAMRDGETLQVGGITLTAVASPGHAPGGMSWTWEDCATPNHCHSVVYLDSLNAVSADGYRFSAHPQVVEALRASIGRLAALPCDIAMAAHPDQLPDGPGDFPTVCARYADAAEDRLDARLAEERRSMGEP